MDHVVSMLKIDVDFVMRYCEEDVANLKQSSKFFILIPF